MKENLALLICFILAIASVNSQSEGIPTIPGKYGQVVFEIRDLPEGTPKKGHGVEAKVYGYRIPSLLVSNKGTTLAFTERRLGLHDHAQNDIVLKRSTDGGTTWGEEIVVYEDGMNSINDPLTVQLVNGRILLMFARFPYGRHARNSGWIKMAEHGYDNPKLNILTYVMHSDDDGLTWSKPRDISRSVKPAHWLNSNTPGAMIQLEKGVHKGRIVASLWGTLPVEVNGEIGRNWEIISAWSDDMGKTWQRSEPLNDPEEGYPNECQIVEAANGNLVIVSRNQGGITRRKKAFSQDGGETWTTLRTDPSLPSVACMGSLIKGPKKKDGTWDLFASFPSSEGRKNGQIAISTDFGKSFQIKKIISGPFAYSATQISADGQNLELFYEADNYKSIRFLSIPLKDL
jgi:sialidase-1